MVCVAVSHISLLVAILTRGRDKLQHPLDTAVKALALFK